jgi:hypothetical protein
MAFPYQHIFFITKKVVSMTQLLIVTDFTLLTTPCLVIQWFLIVILLYIHFCKNVFVITAHIMLRDLLTQIA